MSRLDQHVGLVRNKLALGTLFRAAALAGLILAAMVLLAVLVQRFFHLELPRQVIWFWVALGIAVVAPMVYAIVRRPTARQAAVAIDERLGLYEKFSTALYVRSSKDPFAAAAVRDAEKTASSVSLHKRFPVPYPKLMNVTILMAMVALCTAKWLPQFDLFGVQQRQARIEQQRKVQVASAERVIKQALAEIDSAPRQVAENDQIKMAHQELSAMLEKHTADAPTATKRAQDTLKEIEAIKQKIKDNAKFASTNEAMKNLKDIGPPSSDETGPVADAQRKLSEGKLEDAVEELKKTVDNFDKMDKKEQEKAAQQMKNLANQVAQQANNPAVQQQIQNQLQQAGVSQPQAQQMSKLMQQAANGNQQAAQQLQQMANQAIQQANQQSGQSQAQQKAVAQAIQKAAQQGQQQANGQASAQQMAQATQGLAQAMAQAAQAQGGKQGGQQGGQQAQAKAGQGQQPGQNGQGQGQGQGAQQQMQQQVAQLQAMAKDAQAVAAGQQGQTGQGQGQNGQGQNQGQGQGQQANGQWGNQPGQGGQGNQQGNPQQGQGGGAGPAIAAVGKRPDPTAAAFQVKQELSPSATDEKGKLLAVSFVKAPAEKGESHMKLSEAIESSSKEATDEVDQDRIPRGAQKAVKEYFDTLKNSPPK